MTRNPGKKKRKVAQRKRERYKKNREDLQLSGEIVTTPEGAVASRQERVDPLSQDEQRFPGLDRLAIKGGDGWSVPEHVKRKVVEKAAEVLFDERRITVTDKDGVEKIIELPPDRRAEAQASRTLLEADEKQWERDKPDEAGKARGGGNVNVGVQVALDPLEAYKRMVEELGAEPKDPLQEAIEQAGGVSEHPSPVARDAVQGAPGSQQEILAGRKVLPSGNGDTAKPGPEHRDGGHSG